MSHRKQPSSMLPRRPIRSRSSPYPTVTSRDPPLPPTPQPPQSRVTYVLSPAVQGVLLVPTNAFRLDQQGQWTVGQGVIQLLPAPTVLVPPPKPVRLVVPDVKPAPPPIQKKTVSAPAVTASLPAPAVAVPAPSTAVMKCLPEPVQPQALAAPTAPSSSAHLGPWPSLKTHLQQAALKGRLVERRSGAGDAEDSGTTDDGKLLASMRFRRNHQLMKTVLSATVVRSSEEGRPQQLAPKIDVLEKRLKDLEEETKMMEVRFGQKVEDIGAAEGLFHYKLNRFHQLAALINCREFHQAAFEAELKNLQGFPGVEIVHDAGFL